MNRGDFQKIAEERLKDAEVLLQKKRYSGAYYLCGYVIECALKACIAKQTKEHDFPPERKVIEAVYTHDLAKLIKSAGFEEIFREHCTKDKIFGINWGVVQGWNETSRYEEYDQKKVLDIFQAITDKKHGVLQWVKQRW
jgi:HEPN domain-containing protein